jgi:molybdopterin converting factor small subunit
VSAAPSAPLVTVRYFAGARDAAGVESETIEAAIVSELTDRLAAAHGERLGRILGHASLLVDGVAVHDRQSALPDGATVEILPPFAGGWAPSATTGAPASQSS